MELLTKTRKLNRLLQQAAGKAVSFMEMAEVLRDVVQADVYVVSRRGKILGFSTSGSYASEALQRVVHEDHRFPAEFNALLLKIEETSSTDGPDSPYRFYIDQIEQKFEHNYVTVVPIVGGRDRLGSLVLTRREESFKDDDFLLAEYGSTVVGMEILKERAEENELQARSKAIVEVAIASLSYSELEAVEHIFEELKGKEGLLVASKIADRVGITRSVIVNALRKLESAGVIETRSLGMKGTYIRILNEQLMIGLDKSKV
ncbi:GTP-sensing transcriptional pleiotropic repressor CodY [Paenibacillus sp. J31TS4]|uniref:GTP-sensing pleiotropic transcriptional regulator CodY n=1 Tax=Paenibacillus sp. J31TS4 TaxID=2807195 RepID=UPI001B292913|nr:GTP-sensing pleiotropic transcriptional regulator CodY [Paenibacillus sp. J31TS4]GIP36804.1 GTP-sensing transcriptional pleiotropic repressor CodY [Paenibacillus sp. J31TS4]